MAAVRNQSVDRGGARQSSGLLIILQADSRPPMSISHPAGTRTLQSIARKISAGQSSSSLLLICLEGPKVPTSA